MISSSYWALVLAGGEGMRLQRITRLLTGQPIPKQYCRIVGDRTLLEGTVDRVLTMFSPERTLVVVNAAHVHLARAQLRNLPPENLVVQPSNRDTGPGVLLSLLALERRDPEAVVAMFPSDHYVGQSQAFMRHVGRIRRLVEAMPNCVSMLGIRPTDADPEYGYVLTGRPIDIPGLLPAYHVAGFHEKPTPAEAAQLIAQGGLWNSFVMAFHTKRVLSLLRRIVGERVDVLRNLLGRTDELTEFYRIMSPWNFSRDFLARTPQSLVVARVDDVDWNDWGTPEAIARTLNALGIQPPWVAPDCASAARVA